MNKTAVHPRNHPLSDVELASWMIYVNLLTHTCGVKQLSLDAQMWVV